MPVVTLYGQLIEYVRVGSAGTPPLQIVMLHEGLGSVAMWRSFPEELAQATGAEVIAYSRVGYGKSERLSAPRNRLYMHDEALSTLPRLLEALDVRSPLLFGHSDGASIALIHAGGSTARIAGVVALAPHVFVEEISLRGIESARNAYETGSLRERLTRYHDDVDGAFRGWSDMWLSPAFRDWNIEEYLPRIRSPVLAVQGYEDEYGTMEQLDRIGRGAPEVTLMKLRDCGHSPHRDQPETVLDSVANWTDRIRLHLPPTKTSRARGRRR